MTNEIVQYNGSVSEIPAGWVICDGNNGTPNLNDQCIKCVSNTSTDPGSSFGQDSYSISESQMASHNHSISIDGNSHNHTYEITGSDDAISEPGAPPPVTIHDSGDSYDDGLTQLGGSHDHGTISIGSGGGSSSSVDGRPKMTKQIYIMKT